MSTQPLRIALIGAGIMSATIGIMLRKLMPEATIHIYERLDRVAAESSDAWHNSGTGHSAFCELNYTPVQNGKIQVAKALEIAHQFEISKQLWAYLVEHDCLSYDVPFINTMPHMSFVTGKDNVAFLKARYQTLKTAAIFEDMQYSSKSRQIVEWIPLMMEGRASDVPLAATRMDAGTDVNFGRIARNMIEHLETTDHVEVHLGHSVTDITRQKDGRWTLTLEKRADDTDREIWVDRLFIGAGGGSLPLLNQTGIKESQGYGGFPISGQFLQCTNEDVARRHTAKVYGKAAVGSPPMSVPHLDTRIIDEHRTLFFGPYAGLSTKFLKNGSYFDLPLSIEMHNVWPMLSAGMRNVELTKYLIKQVTLSDEDRFTELLAYYPQAQRNDWTLTTAGQRVQIIKKDAQNDGILVFGTEIVASADRSVAALLGASPGASTSASIAIDVIGRLFPDEIKSESWQRRLRTMIPTFGTSLIDDGALCLETRKRTATVLGL